MGRKALRRKPCVSRVKVASRGQASEPSHGSKVNRKSVSSSLSRFPFRSPFSCCLLLTVVRGAAGRAAIKKYVQ
jgi:hypothetical protein